jgi:diaminopimelate epimerase
MNPSTHAGSSNASGAPLHFFKYEGAGNDFVVLDSQEAGDDGALATRLCDRHFGVGADGVLLVLPPRDTRAVARMKVVNADGSVPEMCGNGLRCVALHLARVRGLGAEYASSTFDIDTDAGVLSCLVERERDAAMVTVDMGEVRMLGDRTLSLSGEEVTLSIADAGNPHAVLFGQFDRKQIREWGTALERHVMFPAGTNVEFATVRDDHIDLVVWERGVGLTLACGTGACATARAAWAKGLVPPGRTAVRLPGGELQVSPGAGQRITMKGPARFVYEGDYHGTLRPRAMV